MSTAEIRKKGRTKKQILLCLPKYSIWEEIINAITHGMGAAASFVALVLLLINTPPASLERISSFIYGVSMVLLYLVSCLYHSLAVGKSKKVFQVLDHCTVYVLIAGTYTPISLVSIGGWEGPFLTAFVWVIALAAIVLNAVDMRRFRVISMVCYLALGWCVLFFLKPLIQGLDSSSLVLLVAGGILYTVGAILYGLGRTCPYMHSIWHLFCLGGSILHFLVVWNVCVVSF